MKDGKTHHSTVKSVSKVFRIIEHLKQTEGSRVTEIAEDLNLPKSSVHNHLSTLYELGYVIQDGETYRLGMAFLHLGESVRRQDHGYEIAQEKVEKLAAETNERAQFIIEEHGRGIYVHRATTPDAVQTDSAPGKHVHLHATSAGKAILAHLADERVEEILDRHGLPAESKKTIQNLEKLWDQFEEIRERGYATNFGENTVGLWAVGAPVFRPNGDVFGALSVSAPAKRMESRIEELPDFLLGVANELELNLAYE